MNMARGSVLVLTTDGLLENSNGRKDMDFSVRCLFDVLYKALQAILKRSPTIFSAARACGPGMVTMWRCFSPGWIGVIRAES